MPKHVFRLVLLLVAFGALGLLAKSYFTAGSFYRYGHYRGNAVAEIASDKPRYQASQSCASCHPRQYALWSTGVHDSASLRTVVRCEVCHGPAGRRDSRGLFRHSASGPVHPLKVALAVPTDTTSLCTRCHEKYAARPGLVVQIEVAAHSGTQPCWSCHNAHSPKLLVGTAQTVAQRGDAEAGKAKAVLCAACHGAEGISHNLPGPSLAGQNEGYLVKSLDAFRAGTRANPMMSGMAKTLSDADIRNAAAYFSGLGATSAPGAAAKAGLWKTGLQKSVLKPVVPPCTACHGADGVSSNPLWPNLAGQSEAYLLASLQAFKDGSRENAIMTGIAKGLSDVDARAAARYFADVGRR